MHAEYVRLLPRCPTTPYPPTTTKAPQVRPPDQLITQQAGQLACPAQPLVAQLSLQRGSGNDRRAWIQCTREALSAVLPAKNMSVR
jgi:hypothetical protein